MAVTMITGGDSRLTESRNRRNVVFLFIVYLPSLQRWYPRTREDSVKVTVRCIAAYMTVRGWRLLELQFTVQGMLRISLLREYATVFLIVVTAARARSPGGGSVDRRFRRILSSRTGGGFPCSVGHHRLSPRAIDACDLTTCSTCVFLAPIRFLSGRIYRPGERGVPGQLER